VTDWKPEELSPLALAFIGDAVWEVYARNHVLASGVRKPNQLHRMTTQYVRAGAQARLVDELTPSLLPEEQDIVRRGRNAKSAHVRKNADVLEYRHSTGFEALIGYLYGSGQTGRLEQLCAQAFSVIDGREG
jgi:ribonuclease III family protein